MKDSVEDRRLLKLFSHNFRLKQCFFADGPFSAEPDEKSGV
jgi:hypothetical protein